LMKAMASCTLGLTHMSSHTQVGSPSSTHTQRSPGCGSGGEGRGVGVGGVRQVEGWGGRRRGRGGRRGRKGRCAAGRPVAAAQRVGCTRAGSAGGSTDAVRAAADQPGSQAMGSQPLGGEPTLDELPAVGDAALPCSPAALQPCSQAAPGPAAARRACPGGSATAAGSPCAAARRCSWR
jgi:hypothetical protein